MAKDVIHLHGQDVTVREDTAKAFRGVDWALISIAAFILIVTAMMVLFFFGAFRDGSVETPSQIQNSQAQ